MNKRILLFCPAMKHGKNQFLNCNNLGGKPSQFAYNTHSHQAVREVEEVPSRTTPKPTNTLQHC